MAGLYPVGGGLITGCPFLFLGRWAYNRGGYNWGGGGGAYNRNFTVYGNQSKQLQNLFSITYQV